MEILKCSVPVAPVRAEPNHRSEMTSQLLYGETLHLLEEKGEWRKVRNNSDGYEGWVTHHLISNCRVDSAISFRLAEPVCVIVKESAMNLPMGSILQENEYNDAGRPSCCLPCRNSPDLQWIMESSLKWLNAPYLWGGKTILGVDCSGFVQTLFSVGGIQLPRDAWQQANEGKVVNLSNEALPGDLAFFSNEQGKVTHVGLVTFDGRIVHASGQVRLDNFKPQGIEHSVSGQLTHKLYSIKRFV